MKDLVYFFVKPIYTDFSECGQDTPYKTALNPPNTAIHPPEWTCDQEDDEMLMAGQPLFSFLQGVAAASHVPRFEHVCRRVCRRQMASAEKFRPRSFVAEHDPFAAHAMTPMQTGLINEIRSRSLRDRCLHK